MKNNSIFIITNMYYLGHRCKIRNHPAALSVLWTSVCLAGSEPVKDERWAEGTESRGRRRISIRARCSRPRRTCRPLEIMFSGSCTPPRSCSPPDGLQLVKINGARHQQKRRLMLFLRRRAKIRSQPRLPRNGGNRAGEWGGGAGNWRRRRL